MADTNQLTPDDMSSDNRINPLTRLKQQEKNMLTLARDENET